MRACWLGVLLLVAPYPTPAGAAPGVRLPAAASAKAEAAVRFTASEIAGRPNAAARGPVLVARYAFNGRSSSILDESGRGHTLSVVSAHGGWVRSVVHGQGAALAFPARCFDRRCPHVALQSPSRADLNPGVRDFSYGADVLLGRADTSSGENIVQKGYSAAGNQWKLQVDGAAGRPSCVLVDGRHAAFRIARSAVSIADGRWHAVSCRRAGTELTISVDGLVRGATHVPRRLSVANDDPLSIGGKGAFADNDQFNGALDNVWMQLG